MTSLQTSFYYQPAMTGIYQWKGLKAPESFLLGPPSRKIKLKHLTALPPKTISHSIQPTTSTPSLGQDKLLLKAPVTFHQTFTIIISVKVIFTHQCNHVLLSLCSSILFFSTTGKFLPGTGASQLETTLYWTVETYQPPLRASS